MKKTLNALGMKRRNRSMILNRIRQSDCSRADLARHTGLTRAAVTLIVEDMLGSGIILEGAKSESTGIGRRATELLLNGAFGHSVGINVTREGYSVGVVDFAGKLLGRETGSISAEEDPKSVLETICRAADRMKEQVPGIFLGVGVTTPGPLDRERGVLLQVPNFEKWQGFAIVDFLEKRLRCQARLDNNANAMAMLENVVNREVQDKDFVLLTVDSGLGSGVVLNSRGRGMSFDSEFGHMTLDIGGETCSCGNVGCAELYASAHSILRYARERDPGLATWHDVMEGYGRGEEICREVVERECRYLGAVIVNAVNCFRVDAVVFAGPLTEGFDALRPMLREAVSSSVFKEQEVSFYVTRTQDAEVLSSANLIVERFIAVGE